MDFYPVYKICSVSGAFSRIGSLLETCRHWSVKTTWRQWDQARALFTQRPGDVILSGPRMAIAAGKGRLGVS